MARFDGVAIPDAVYQATDRRIQKVPIALELILGTPECTESESQ
jgi:hypothetical protein